jgi:hypothetical protein
MSGDKTEVLENISSEEVGDLKRVFWSAKVTGLTRKGVYVLPGGWHELFVSRNDLKRVLHHPRLPAGRCSPFQVGK